MKPSSGACLCGQITYVISGQIQSSGHCHCETCRKWQAAAFASWVSCKIEDFRILSGANRLNAYESTKGVYRKFCSRCGTPLFYTSDAEPKFIYATLASISGPPEVCPTRHVSFEEQASWFSFSDPLPKYHGKTELLPSRSKNTRSMLNHLSIGVKDLQKSIAFYDAALRPLGFQRLWTTENAAGFGIDGSDEPFAIKQESTEVILGSSPRSHLAFTAETRAMVDAFFLSSMEQGGMDIGKPGVRKHYGEHYYAAFVQDLDGYRLESVCHQAPGTEGAR